MGRQKGDPRLREAFMNNPECVKRMFSNLSPEEQHKRQINGGQATKRKYERDRKLRDAARSLMQHRLDRMPDEKEILKTLVDMGVEKPTGADAIMLAQYVRARKGDTDAARFIRDTVGEKPSQVIDVSYTDKPIDAIDFSALDDAQLEALAAARNMTLIPGPVIEAEAAEEEEDAERDNT